MSNIKDDRGKRHHHHGRQIDVNIVRFLVCPFSAFLGLEFIQGRRGTFYRQHLVAWIDNRERSLINKQAVVGKK